MLYNTDEGKSTVYVRPEWVCGRYDSKSHAALLYNLIEGLVYFFKDVTADVIGEILNTRTDECVSVDRLNKKYNIEKSTLDSFLYELLHRGILTDKRPNKDGIMSYRLRVGETRLLETERIKSFSDQIEEKFPNSAEKAYREYVNPQVGVVQIELTYNCNERCVHCYNPGATRNEAEQNRRKMFNELELTDYKRIIDELYDLGVYKINLTGGDPFSKPIVWDIIEYIHNKGIAYDLYTNGQVISYNFDRLLALYPKSVGISIYSGNEEIHDGITRTVGSFNRSLSVIKMLSKYGVPFSIKCCIMKWNIKSYTSVADIAIKYGGIMQYDYKLIDSVDGDKCVGKYLLLDEEELELVLQDEYVEDKTGYLKYNKNQMNEKPCNAGYIFFCITPEGNVQLCNCFPWSVGNLRDSSFRDILCNSSRLREWRNLKISDLQECGEYDYCKCCNICVGNNYCEHGTFYKPSELSCKLARIRYKILKKILSGKPLLSRKELLESLEKTKDIRKVAHRILNKSYRL